MMGKLHDLFDARNLLRDTANSTARAGMHASRCAGSMGGIRNEHQ